MIRRIALTTLAVALGCEVKNVGDLDTSNVSDTNDTESSSGGEESSSGDSMTSVSTDPTVGESSSGGEESGSGTGGCGVSMCGAHEEQQVAFVIDSIAGPAVELIDVPCTVIDDGDIGPLTLDCVEDGMPVTHEIAGATLGDYALSNINQGREVLFSWVLLTPFWSESYFSIRSTEGELILAGGSGSTLTPAQGFYDPIDPVEVVPMCGTECANSCFQWVRTAIEFKTALGSEIVLDGSANVVEKESDYFIRVGTSESRFNFTCSDVPDIWHEWLVERVTTIP